MPARALALVLQDSFEKLLSRTYYGNTLLDYLIFAGILLSGVALISAVRALTSSRLRRWAEHTRSTADDFLVDTLQRLVIPLLYYAVFYVGVRNLALHPILVRVVDIAGVVLLTIAGIRFLTSGMEYLIRTHWLRRGDAESAENATRAIIPAIHVVVWGLGILYLLENLGFKISAIVTGLGIGGIAVALAAQAVLADLFSYFAILFDKPFEVGDFISVDDYMGSIEHVGVKTTRIRSLSGEQLVFSNTDLTKSRLRNYKRLERRRVEFTFKVRLDTPRDRAAAIPNIVAGIIKAMPGVTFDRAHFASFGDFSLTYDVVYIIASADYNRYMDIQQEINLRIMEELEQRGVQFAYPAQTLFVQERNGVAADGTRKQRGEG